MSTAAPSLDSVMLVHGRVCRCGTGRPNELVEAQVKLRGMQIAVTLTYDGVLVLPNVVRLPAEDVRCVEQVLPAVHEVLEQRFAAHNQQRLAYQQPARLEQEMVQ